MGYIFYFFLALIFAHNVQAMEMSTPAGSTEQSIINNIQKNYSCFTLPPKDYALSLQSAATKLLFQENIITLTQNYLTAYTADVEFYRQSQNVRELFSQKGNLTNNRTHLEASILDLVNDSELLGTILSNRSFFHRFFARLAPEHSVTDLHPLDKARSNYYINLWENSASQDSKKLAMLVRFFVKDRKLTAVLTKAEISLRDFLSYVVKTLPSLGRIDLESNQEVSYIKSFYALMFKLNDFLNHNPFVDTTHTNALIKEIRESIEDHENFYPEAQHYYRLILQELTNTINQLEQQQPSAKKNKKKKNRKQKKSKKITKAQLLNKYFSVLCDQHIPEIKGVPLSPTLTALKNYYQYPAIISVKPTLSAKKALSKAPDNKIAVCEAIPETIVESDAPHFITINDENFPHITHHLFKISAVRIVNLQKIMYTPWVSAWLTNPEQAFMTQGYAAFDSNRFQHRATAKEYHAFSTQIDTLVFEHGVQTTTHNNKTGQADILIALPGKLCDTHAKKDTVGLYTYIFDSKTHVCYHRLFTPRASAVLLKEYLDNGNFSHTAEGFYDVEFPAIGDLSLTK